MRRGLLIGMGALLLANVAARESDARPRRRGRWLEGHVTAVTLNAVFFDLGAHHGVRAGEVVQLRWRREGRRRRGGRVELRLDAVAEHSARAPLPVGSLIPPRGARARLSWRDPPQRRHVRHLPRAEDPSRAAARWVQLPAVDRPLLPYRARQSGHGARGGQPEQRDAKARARVTLGYGLLADLGNSTPQASLHQLTVDSEVDLPRLFTSHLDYSHRLRLQVFAAHDLTVRPFQDARPLLLLRRARLGLTVGGLRAEFGRLDGIAAADGGLVDGATVRVRLGQFFYLRAFGGLAPPMDTLGLDTHATRFGAETGFRLFGQRGGRLGELAADLGVLGSTYAGQVDRRALALRLRWETEGAALYAQTIVDYYGADHPSGLSTIDASFLSLEGRVSLGSRYRVAARFDRYRYVPTREILDRFGLDYASGQPVNSGRLMNDLRFGDSSSVLLDVGIDSQAAEGDAGQTWAGWGELSYATRGVFRDDDGLRVAALGSYGSLQISAGGRAGYVFTPTEWLTLGGSYLLAWDRYRDGVDATQFRHGIGASADLSLGRHFLCGLDSMVTLSGEERVLQLFATVSAYL